MYIKRSAEKYLEFLAEHFPALIVTGARQVGKTTLIRHLMDEREGFTYVTLDYPPLRALARSDPELFLQQYSTPLMIDEIQYAPELLPYIKISIDNNRTPGRFFLTGSQSFRLMKNVSESLAGRVGILNLYGLTNAEIEGKNETPFLPKITKFNNKIETITSIFDKIIRGSMSQMVIDSGLTSEAYFGEYVQTYLERDIRDIIQIKNESKFLKFLSCVAARTAQEVNLLDIGKEISIDSKTAESWLSLLVSSGLVMLISPYSGNTIKRIIKRPKLYFMDTGLACYLSLWNNARALEQSAMAGALFETYVIGEIIKEYSNAGLDVRSHLAFYRDSNGKEIDLLIVDNGKIYPIEIKKSANPGKDALKNFSVLDSLDLPRGEGAVICLSSMSYSLDKDNKAIPISYI